MIEVPRAALTAGEIAREASFFSFGTNDLTQMTWGLSRDDVEGSFFPRYFALGILDVSPFESIDTNGVGVLISLADPLLRGGRPRLRLLLAVPGSRRPSGGGTSGDRGQRSRRPVGGSARVSARVWVRASGRRPGREVRRRP